MSWWVPGWGDWYRHASHDRDASNHRKPSHDRDAGHHRNASNHRLPGSNRNAVQRRNAVLNRVTEHNRGQFTAVFGLTTVPRKSDGTDCAIDAWGCAVVSELGAGAGGNRVGVVRDNPNSRRAVLDFYGIGRIWHVGSWGAKERRRSRRARGRWTDRPRWHPGI